MKPLKVNDRDITSVRLRSVTYFPSLGNLGPTVTKTGPNKGLATIVLLRKVAEGVLMQAIASIGPNAGKAVEVFIPQSILELVEFADLSETDNQETGNAAVAG